MYFSFRLKYNTGRPRSKLPGFTLSDFFFICVPTLNTLYVTPYYTFSSSSLLILRTAYDTEFFLSFVQVFERGLSYMQRMCAGLETPDKLSACVGILTELDSLYNRY
jgi:hypothetical protein